MSFKLISLLCKTEDSYEYNLQELLKHIKKSPDKSLIVAPEVCLTGFDYANLESTCAFALRATTKIEEISKNKIIILTMLEKRDDKVYNMAKVFYDGRVIYERAKARLFRIGDEHKFMEEGSDEEFKIIEVLGMKIAILICFELRFKELWKKAEGADIIAVPSWWGKPRTEHFQIFTQTLAVMNQCYVVASDSLNEECTQKSSIISPRGEVLFNEDRVSLEVLYKQKEIDVMRRYIDVGIA